MKNQYVGDIGDYGKYSLLRFLACNGVKLGINWYFTKNDEIIKDGNIRDYLSKEEERIYDPYVYDFLKTLEDEKVRDLKQIEESDIIPGAIYYSDPLEVSSLPLGEREDTREKWHIKAKEVLADADLIFLDPDNGSCKPDLALKDKGEKYASIWEICDYYHNGKDVVYYCQRGRWHVSIWLRKKQELADIYPDLKIIILRFRRGTQRVFIFGIHPENYERYEKLLTDFLQTAWGNVKLGTRNIPFSRDMFFDW